MASLIPTSPPAKRQKTDGSYSSSNSNTNAYNSEADSGDELFEGFIPDTPAIASDKYETQPTQIIDRSTNLSRLTSPPETPKNEVQVPASSPLAGKDITPVKQPVSNGALQQNRVAPQKRSLAMSMAPAGTAFKPPHGIVRKPAAPTKTYITIDDDEPQLIDSDSSDDDLSAQADIKPSTFKPMSAQSSFNLSPPQPVNGNAKFQNIVSNAAYKGLGNGRDFTATSSGMSSASKLKTAVSMSMGYGSVKRPLTQMRPERAQPIQDISMEDLGDHALREKVTRLRAAFPLATVLTCRNALISSRGNVDDAASILVGGPHSISDPDEIASPRALMPKMPQAQTMKKPEPMQMKRTLDAPLASLKDRYSSTQGLPSKPAAVVTPPPKPKKKLVQGRRHPSSPAIPAVSSPLKGQPSPVISLDEYGSDSGVASATEQEDPELEDRVLKFLNKCTLEELVELTSTSKPYAELMIEARPFKSCDAARCVENPTKTKGGKKSTRAPIGEKIVDTALNMFTGYEAIDALVSKCKELGKPLNDTMSTWGFDVFGAAKDGELEMTSFEDEHTSQRDSGIGSPNSGATSLNDDADDEVKAITSTRKKNANFIKQPAIMSEDVALKDYQVVGLNWLALMYRQKLSGILADEMGLGKTCQVIALLSHLVETGHPGPHLVICPGSTLENWLREIPRFSPGLTVDVYYGVFNGVLCIRLQAYCI
jgi:SWI/SNF-related matrix-associated actin-dependent regulator 1 of chromatin subfamily A